MPHLLPRASSAGCALVLLTALGPASGTPGPGPAAAETVVSTRPVAVDTPDTPPIRIPCVSGTCEVSFHGAAAIPPLRPGPPPAADQPVPYALGTAAPQP